MSEDLWKWKGSQTFPQSELVDWELEASRLLTLLAEANSKIAEQVEQAYKEGHFDGWYAKSNYAELSYQHNLDEDWPTSDAYARLKGEKG